MHLVQSLMRLYSCLMDEIIATLEYKAAEGEDPPQGHLSSQQVNYTLPFDIFS